jgi:hypothetical protein
VPTAPVSALSTQPPHQLTLRQRHCLLHHQLHPLPALLSGTPTFTPVPTCPQAVSRESYRTRNKNKQTNCRFKCHTVCCAVCCAIVCSDWAADWAAHSVLSASCNGVPDGLDCDGINCSSVLARACTGHCTQYCTNFPTATPTQPTTAPHWQLPLWRHRLQLLPIHCIDTPTTHAPSPASPAVSVAPATNAPTTTAAPPTTPPTAASPTAVLVNRSTGHVDYVCV